jgi:hypothetical protein
MLLPMAPSMGLSPERYTKYLGSALRLLKNLRLR